MELWDAYNSKLQQIPGVTLVRGEPVPDGMHHLVCNIIVRHADGTYLLMQRHPDKPWGGMWEATAGGSALAGETPLRCAMRELREETGIQARDLTEISRTTTSNALHVDFFCETDCDKNAVTLQDGETTAYRWVSREELLAMRSDELLTERGQQYIRDLGS